MKIEGQRTWFKPRPGLSIKMILNSNISPRVKWLHSKWIFFPESKMKDAFRLACFATQAGSKNENQKMKGMNMESKESSWEIYFACGSWNLFLVPVEVQITLESNLPELPSQPGCAGPSCMWLLTQTAEQCLAPALLAQELQKGEQLSILALKTSVKKSCHSIKVSFMRRVWESSVPSTFFFQSKRRALKIKSSIFFGWHFDILLMLVVFT